MNELVKVEDGKIIVEQDIVKQIREFEQFKAEMDLKEKHLKEALKEAFEQYGITSWSTDGLSAKYKSATTRKSIDTKRLKEELPDIYEEYIKESNVASSISLTIS
jgi:predicted phage-related endonuclease